MLLESAIYRSTDIQDHHSQQVLLQIHEDFEADNFQEQLVLNIKKMDT